MDHGSHGGSSSDSGMDMGGGSCKISMLWNWYTVDSCFLSETWHVTSKAQFAGTIIGIFLLVASIEGVRRLGREYDRRLLRARADAVANATCGSGTHTVMAQQHAPVPACHSSSGGHAAKVSTPSEEGTFGQLHCRALPPKLPTWGQQAIRSCIYGSQFTAAFLVMLLGMYFNGFVLFAIFLGGTFGYLIFGSDTVSSPEAAAKNESPCCC